MSFESCFGGFAGAKSAPAAMGRVGMWRGGVRSTMSVAAPFVWRCLSGSTMAPFPHPAHRTGQARPACPSRASGWSSLTTPWASRVSYAFLVYMLPPLPRRSGWAYCFARSPQPCQPSPKGLSGRPAHCPFRGLLSVHSRCGLHTRAVTNS